MKRIIIACKTCWQYQKRREQCLKTWIPQVVVASPWVRHVMHFAVGSIKTWEISGVYLFLPVADHYPPSPIRMKMLCEWCLLDTEWDYLFCMDDDTRLDVARLWKYDTAGHDYIGPEWRPGAGYASGGGNFLSRRAARVVAEHLRQPLGHDDAAVGAVLAEHGIPLAVDNDHFKVLMGLDDAPGPGNDWVYATPRARET